MSRNSRLKRFTIRSERKRNYTDRLSPGPGQRAQSMSPISATSFRHTFAENNDDHRGKTNPLPSRARKLENTSAPRARRNLFRALLSRAFFTGLHHADDPLPFYASASETVEGCAFCSHPRKRSLGLALSFPTSLCLSLLSYLSFFTHRPPAS